MNPIEELKSDMNRCKNHPVGGLRIITPEKAQLVLELIEYTKKSHPVIEEFLGVVGHDPSVGVDSSDLIE